MAIVCGACGADNPDNAKFCISCGTGLAPSCPSCANDNPPGAKFCANCGAGLGLGENVAPAARRDSKSDSEAERRQLTVMFCDLVGSTALSARLDPEEMRDIIRDYQDACARVVTRLGGFVAKYMGDGALVYFGYPEAHEDDAERAAYAGLGVVEAVAALDRGLAVRIGIATGTVVVGDIVGEGAAREAAITGETPNLAARLQEIAEPDTVVMGEATRRLTGELFETVALGARALKGFEDAVPAWRVVRARRAESRFDATRPANLSPLVGRDEEIEMLTRRWRRAKQGDGEVVLIAGEPGIGKSRLAHALQERLEAEPHTPIRLQCSPIHANSALFPMIEQLERAAGFTSADGAGDKLDKLETLLDLTGEAGDDVRTLFAELLSIPTDGRYKPLNLAPEERMSRTLGLIADRMLRMAAARPVLFALEDAHWIDPTTLELIDRIIDGAPEAAMLMLITYRPEFAAPWVGRPRVTQLALNRLDRRTCAEMVGAMAGAEKLTGAVRDAIVERTDGVPLFVEELTRSVLETGGGEAAPSAEAEIPATLKDSLEARLDRLGPAKEIAQLGAAIGRTFDYDLISRVATIEEGELRDMLDRLVASELMQCRGAPPVATYTFKHALVQDAAYDSLLRRRREAIHGRIAETLERDFRHIVATQPDLLAQHYTASGQHEPASAYWLQAGQTAFNRSAVKEALAHVTAGLKTVSALPDGSGRIATEEGLEAIRALALKMSLGLAHAETEAAFERAYELGADVEGSPYVFPVLFGLMQSEWASGRSDRAQARAEDLMTRAEISGDREQLLVAHSCMGFSLYQRGDCAAGHRHLVHANKLYDTETDTSFAYRYMVDFGVMNRFYDGIALLALGYPDQALKKAEDAVALARQRQPINLAASLNYGGDVALERGEVATVLEWCEESAAIATEFGFSHQIAYARINLGCAYARLGRNEEAIELIESGIVEQRAGGYMLYVSRCLLYVATALIGDDRAEEALAKTEEALALIAEYREHCFESLALIVKGDALLALDRADAAEGAYREAVDIAREQSARSWELRAATRLAGLWRRQGKPAEARDLLAPVHGWFTEGFDTADLMAAKALLDALG